MQGRPVGSFGDFTTILVLQGKIITTGGEGGLLALDDDELWEKSLGASRITASPARPLPTPPTGHPPGFRWLHESFGTNFRMTSIQAVLGSKQLQYLQDWRHQRTRNASFLIRDFAQQEALYTPTPPPAMRHAWYRLYTFVRPDRLKEGWNRDRILRTIRDAGVECFSGSCSEIYLEKAFQEFAPPVRLPVARQLGETSLAFLVDPAQTQQGLETVAHTVREVVSAASLN